ncbi:hypothetical protein CBS147332_8275 [Penicillium roqueforti]|nr:hypothetical protein CBS147332_8275 [Penicillium roqueforti]KAI3099947.1 hypothetical protein CBS147331_8318 [Penicillium roqueforti]
MILLARAVSIIRKMPEPYDLFEYTSGRWIYNDRLKNRERRRVFNVSGLKRLTAIAIQQNGDDAVGFLKLAEGGFNRNFLITMRDGFRFVARIPYPVTKPKSLVVASEVYSADLVTLFNNELIECLRLERAQSEADTQFQACQEAVGVGHEGWVPIAHYDEAKARERKLRADALDMAETEERTRIQENWIFDDFSEDDYT